MPSPDTQSLSDTAVQGEIRAILALPSSTKSSTGLSIKFVQDHLRNAYGSDGKGFPGRIPADRQQGLIAANATAVSEAANIQVLYAQWVLGTVATLPNEDPGRAEAGLGPLPNPLSGLQSLLGFLGNPVRLGELVVGVVMVGVAFAAVLKRGNK
jgi:hypothetical protein